LRPHLARVRLRVTVRVRVRVRNRVRRVRVRPIEALRALRLVGVDQPLDAPLGVAHLEQALLLSRLELCGRDAAEAVALASGERRGLLPQVLAHHATEVGLIHRIALCLQAARLVRVRIRVRPRLRAGVRVRVRVRWRLG
tara:strand:- start:59 stop:478 length:420 start_codon:yes stop_codon:yes gene_type:complete